MATVKALKNINEATTTIVAGTEFEMEDKKAELFAKKGHVEFVKTKELKINKANAED